jgi:hypothetical protein
VARFGALLICAMFAGTAVDACLFSCDRSLLAELHRSCHDSGHPDGVRVQGSPSHCGHGHGAAAFEPVLLQKNPRFADSCQAMFADRVDRWTFLSSLIVQPPSQDGGLQPAPGKALNLPLLI